MELAVTKWIDSHSQGKAWNNHNPVEMAKIQSCKTNGVGVTTPILTPVGGNYCKARVGAKPWVSLKEK